MMKTFSPFLSPPELDEPDELGLDEPDEAHAARMDARASTATMGSALLKGALIYESFQLRTHVTGRRDSGDKGCRRGGNGRPAQMTRAVAGPRPGPSRCPHDARVVLSVMARSDRRRSGP